jgi:ubiquinone/menaquinone biosynthesis C-methylase UbiE
MNCISPDKRSRIEIIRDHYAPKFGSDRLNHEILDWESMEAQHSRFAVLSEYVPLSGKSLLDVGCGLADLYAFLTEHGIRTEYTGIDILPQMASAARERFPEIEIIHGDAFSEPELFSSRVFDVVFSSGIFNLNLGNNIEFLENALRVFSVLSSQYIVFNLLSERSDDKEEKYYYYSIRDVEHVVNKFSFSNVKIVEDYLLNDLSAICIK